jgi:hypothetical protein
MKSVQMKPVTAALAIGAMLWSSPDANAGACDAALVMSTYRSSSSIALDWRLADLVEESSYREIRNNQGASGTIYGVPVGANYDDFRKTVESLKHQTRQSLSYSQQQNLAWTGLDPNAPSSYQACLRSQPGGLKAYVIGATTTDIVVQISWTAPGHPTARIVTSGQNSGLYPEELSYGEVQVRVPRPQQTSSITINSTAPRGFAASFVLEPLPPPPKPVAPEYPSPNWYSVLSVRGGGYLNVYGSRFLVRSPLAITEQLPAHQFKLNKVGEPNTYEIQSTDTTFIVGRWQGGIAHEGDAIVLSQAGTPGQTWVLERASGGYRLKHPNGNLYVALGVKATAPAEHYSLVLTAGASGAAIWTFR